MKSKSRLFFILVILFAGIFACSCFLLSACGFGEVEDEGEGDDDGEIYLVSISADASEAQTEFFVDDEYTSEGLTVTAEYSDNSVKAVTEYTVDETSYDMAEAGKYAVKIAYTEGDITVYGTYEITVSAISLVRVDFDTSSVKTEFFVGDEFSTEGLVAVATYSDGSKVDVTDKVMASSSYDMGTAGTYTIQVSYSEDGATYSNSYSINVRAATLSSLILDTSAAKTEFYVGEEFTYSGLAVTATYDDGEEKEISSGEYTVTSDYDKTKGGEYKITVSYSEDDITATAEYTVTVIAKLTGISASGAKAEFYVGGEFSTRGLVVTALYDDGTEKEVTGYTVDDSAFDGDTLGDYTIVVTYIENGVTVTTSYIVTVKLSYELVFILNGDGYEVSGISGTYSDVVIPSEYNGLPVTAIADDAFQFRSSLKSIIIGENVERIGDRAFYNCTALSAIIIPDSVTSIGNSAFYYCTSLTTLTIGEGVKTIENYAFAYCTALAEINFNATSMDDLVLENDVFLRAGMYGEGINVTIGANVESIPARLFFEGLSDGTGIYYTYPYIKSVVFEEGSKCVSIGAHAFQACASLESVLIGDSVEIIGDRAFLYCTSLTSVTIGKNLTSIGYEAFCYCSEVTDIIIPNSVTNIGERAFYNCSSLTNLTIGDEVETIEEYSFAFCTSLESVTIGNNVTAIGDYAFYRCTALIAIVIPNSVTTIGEFAFESCSSLTYLTIGDGVETIGDYSFAYCPSLESVIIGEAVRTIGNYAFYDCHALTEIKFNAISMDDLSINNHVFRSDEQDGKGASVVIGSNVERIPAYLFYYSDISRIIFVEDSKCESIGEYTFAYCASLESASIGNNVTSIGYRAFYNCTALTEIYFNATNMADLSMDNTVFYDAGIYSGGITVTIGLSVERIPACLFFSGWNENTSQYSGYPYITGVIFEEGGKCESIGAHAFQACPSLESVIIGDSVKNIGEKAFFYCTSLTNVEFGRNVTSIGESAFYGCASLTDVTIGESVETIEKYAFYRCSSLTTIIIPNGVIYIEESAFENCTALVSIIIPDSVTNIGDYAFYNCSSLLNATISNSVIDIGIGTFSYCSSLTCVTIGVNVMTIGDYVFYGCTALASIIIPDSVTDIGKYAFFDCSSLACVTIGENVMTIGDYVFCGCSSLLSLTIPNEVVTIGEGAFAYCTSLTSLTIGEGVKTVEKYVFYNCTALTEINFNATNMDDLSFNDDVFYKAGIYREGIIVTIGSSVERIPACLFYFGTYEDTSMYSSYPYITSVVFEEGSKCESIGAHAFQAISSLESVIIGANVTTIGEYAFYFCTSLKSIASSENVTTIGEYAFFYCSSLTSITLGESLTTIGEYAFYYCDSLTSITIGKNVTNIGDGTFYHCTAMLEVYYFGTVDDWNQIEIGDNNFSLIYATKYYYSEFAPTEDGNWWHYDEDGKATIWQ